MTFSAIKRKASKRLKRLQKTLIKRKNRLHKRFQQAVKPAKKRLVRFAQGLSPTQRKNIISLAILVIIGIGLGANIWYKNQPAPNIEYDQSLSQFTALESRMLVGGDIYWGRRMHDWSQQSSLKEAYPFSRLGEFQRDRYDTWIANLECPAVPGIKQPVGFVPELWEFNCDTDYMDEAAKWFDIFSLANNHSQNQRREAGLTATRQELDKQGIQHFGNFNPHVKKDVCEVVAMPVRVRLDGKQQPAQLPVALCGFHGVYYTITDESMAVMRQYAEVMPVIAFPHMGQEYQAVADQRRRDLYRTMIDNGADAVLGNHPHWVQPSEVYKGKLIIYSMGNFIFDQQFSEEVMRSAAIDIIMSLPQGATSEEQLQAWTELGKSCTSFQDTCLTAAKAKGLQRLPVSYHYNIVGVDLSNQITKRANLRVHNAILERLDWQKTQQLLKEAGTTSDR